MLQPQHNDSWGCPNLVHFLKAEVDELILRKKQPRSVTSIGGRISSVATPNGGNDQGRGRRGREQKETVKQLRRQGEAMAAANSDTMSIQSLVTQAVNEKLEAAVICGVVNATNNSNDYSPTTVTNEFTANGSDCSTIQSTGSKKKAQSGNVGSFLSNKKLQI